VSLEQLQLRYKAEIKASFAVSNIQSLFGRDNRCPMLRRSRCFDRSSEVATMYFPCVGKNSKSAKAGYSPACHNEVGGAASARSRVSSVVTA